MMKKLLFLSLFVLFISPVFSQVTFDNDGGDGLWGTATNWSTDVLPTSSDDVIIPDGQDVTIAAGTAAVAGTLLINGSLTMDNDPTATLDVGTPPAPDSQSYLEEKEKSSAKMADNK
ncbi:MAG: G8 domain-containing protein [bacterium]|jgi:hypothetical protein